MQANPRSIEREAAHRLPALLAELLDEPAVELTPEVLRGNRQIDLLARDSQGRRWAFEVKGAGGPGQVDRAAEQLRAMADEGFIAVLVVPYMSGKGAETAERRGVSWLDLSGNAHIRAENLYISVQGRPNALRGAGRPSSPFAPKSARISRTLLLDPKRWWRQRDLAAATGLDDGSVSRTVRRLGVEQLLERREAEIRPRDPGLLLDAWAEGYRFDRHESVRGHVSGSGVDLARSLAEGLAGRDVHFAFTGLPAAWAIDGFARFRLVSIYIDGDPRAAADMLAVRREIKGANVQLLGPDDRGVFDGEGEYDGLRCVSPVQAYLDLLALPERAVEAAEHLRRRQLGWDGSAA
jgi:hypothetical protein